MKFSLVLFSVAIAWAQDPGPEINKFLASETGNRLKLSFEFRTRFEERDDNNFGRSPNLQSPLFRTRLGAQFKAASWLKLVGTALDARAPDYGAPAPVSARDTIDLHEAYAEFFPDRKGFGAIVGRQSFSLAEGRIIGVPNWRNTSRSFDTVRLYHRSAYARVEFMYLSLVDIKPDSFNKPRLGDRVWGVYNTFSKWVPKGTVDLYILRRDQNRPGGFTQPGRLGVNTFGVRAAGSLPWNTTYSTELAAQTGRNSAKSHRGLGAYGTVGHRMGIFTASVEYKYASGDNGKDATRETTFEQLYPANHDKFGQADLVGWRNIHNLRSVESVQINKRLTANFMYDSWWLASKTDGLYDIGGRTIVRSASGSAGRHVGQEFDLYSTYQPVKALQFGAGIAKLVPGDFLKNTTPSPHTVYFYVFQTYSF